MLPPDSSLVFPELDFPYLQHAFTLRVRGTELQRSCRETLESLSFPCENLIEAEQPHGNLIGKVDIKDSGKIIPLVDGLITNTRGLTLAIRTADCGPLFLYDPEHQAIGVVHSGKKGTQSGILSKAVKAMKEAFGSNPLQLKVVLAPCIRPPHYDLDFAESIREQAAEAGVVHYRDCCLNTGADLSRFYSYRVEKGQTGRHYAVMRLAPLPDSDPDKT